MKKRLTSFLLVLALSFSFSLPAFAVDDSNYYSFPPVGGSELFVAMDWPVNPAEFSNSDSQTLTNIYKYIQYLTLSPASWQRNSIVGFLERILDAIPANLGTNFALQGSSRGTNVMLDEIAKWTMFSYNYLSSDNIAGNLGNIQRNTLASADRLTNSNTLLGSISDSVRGVALDSSVKSIDDFLKIDFSKPVFNSDGSASVSRAMSAWDFLGYIPLSLNYDGKVDLMKGGLDANDYTIFHYVKNLSETLASEDDKQLAENQKENREQAESDFLSGKSGKTSLGKGDFSNASQVGGALNDTFNMGGAAKVSDFLSGFGSAGTESQAWFSQTTANNLNAVEASVGTQGVSTFADDGETMVDVDPDPYNMANIFDRYDWLEGVSMDG